MAQGWTAIGLGLGLVLLAGCEPYASQIPTTERPQLVPVAQMPEACRRAASNRFAQLLQNTSASAAVEQPNGTWLVSGSFPNVSGTQFFQCQFTAEGNMVGVFRPGM